MALISSCQIFRHFSICWPPLLKPISSSPLGKGRRKIPYSTFRWISLKMGSFTPATLSTWTDTRMEASVTLSPTLRLEHKIKSKEWVPDIVQGPLGLDEGEVGFLHLFRNLTFRLMDSLEKFIEYIKDLMEHLSESCSQCVGLLLE